MEKFVQIKMAELIKVEDPDSEGGLTLVFNDNKQIKIKVVDGKLVSKVVSSLIINVFFVQMYSHLLQL